MAPPAEDDHKPEAVPAPAVEAPPAPSLRIRPNATRITLMAGKPEKLVVSVTRRGFAADVSVGIAKLPLGVTAKSVTLPAGSTEATLELVAAANSANADDALDAVVVATAKGLSAESPLKIVVNARPGLTIVQAPTAVTLKGGQTQSLTVRIDRAPARGL